MAYFALEMAERLSIYLAGRQQEREIQDLRQPYDNHVAWRVMAWCSPEVFNRIWNSIFGDRLTSGRFGRAIAVFLTFNFVSFCWIFFRAPDMSSAITMLRQITGSFSPGSYLTVLPAYGSVFMLIIAGYIIHLLPEKIKESYRGLFISIPLAAQLAVILVVAILLLQMRTAEVMPFIYFRF